MNIRNFRNALTLPALIAVGLLGNTAPIRAQSMILQQPVGSWLYTVTIPVDGDPADNIVFQGVETYMLGGGYIETDQLSFSPTLGLSTPSHGSWASTGGSDFLMTYFNFTFESTDPKALSYVAPYNVAIVYAGLGNSDRTFAWLDRAYTQRSYYLPVYLTTDARLDRFHGDPRFLDLRRRIGLPK